MLDVSFNPDPANRAPLYNQLAATLRELIEAGRLGAGEKLPPTRDLAGSLGLSRNTVNRAYEQLAGAGLAAGIAARPRWALRVLFDRPRASPRL